MKRYRCEDTIVAISTPVGEGGIGIIRMSGPEALRISDEIFLAKDSAAPSRSKGYTVHYGHIVSKGSRVKGEGSRRKKIRFVDEVLLTVMRAPRSYTKEDVVEINCHGGIRALKEVLELVIGHGARTAEPGEFTKRAFLNGRIDLAQAEAVMDTIRAKTESSLRAAASQLAGELSDRVNEIRDDLIDIASRVEASIDFAEDDLDVDSSAMTGQIDKISSGLKSLIATASEGMILREGLLVVICGKPNTGKSSLMNLLLKRDRVIVTPVPGTTRDAVEEMISLEGIPVRLVDTAGIADTEDAAEEEGIRRSKRYLEAADMVIVLFDGSVPLDDADMAIMRLVEKKKAIAVINKIDLGRKLKSDSLKGRLKCGRIIEISVLTKKNIGLLEKAIAEDVWKGKVYQGESAIVTNARHRELLEGALDSVIKIRKALDVQFESELVAIDLKEAIFNLGLIVGKSISDDMLDRIFGQFCIGK